MDQETLAGELTERLMKAADPDKWAALFSVAFDELGDAEEAMDVADELSSPKQQIKSFGPTNRLKASYFEECDRDEEGHCLPSGEGGSGGGAERSGSRITTESTTPPPPGRVFKPDVHKDSNGDGITDTARVGVPAFDVPPPPPVGRLPNLTKFERSVESAFLDAFHNDPDGMADRFKSLVAKSTKEGEPPTYGTDDAKALASVWSKPKNMDKRSANRATLNLALHQTANAIAKRAFLKELDGLNEGDEIMVTVGGCGAGKGFALKNVPQALEVKYKSKAVWDSAGDQNATENPWIQAEAEKRGLKVNYVYVHADPETQWAHPERGVVKRAGDPNDGRMVDANVFADSYALGAKNHQAFYEKHKGSDKASFIFLENRGKPTLLDGIPKEALGLDGKKLAKFAQDAVQSAEGVPPHVKRGALMGSRIWSEK